MRNAVLIEKQRREQYQRMATGLQKLGALIWDWLKSWPENPSFLGLEFSYCIEDIWLPFVYI